MKPNMQGSVKTGLSYELLLFITIAQPFELIAVHFLISRYNITIAWVVTLSSILSVAWLWWVWMRQNRQKAAKLELEEPQTHNNQGVV
jgi:type VI protein secretion system component VasK